MQTIKKFTEEQLKEIDKLVAIHLFGHAWFYFPAQEETKDLPQNHPKYRAKVDAMCSLMVPSHWQIRHGATRVDKPHPTDKLDIDIPAYHKDEDYICEICEMCLGVDEEHPVTLWKTFDGGYCYGDIQGDHYEAIPLALVMFALKKFGVTLPF